MQSLLRLTCLLLLISACGASPLLAQPAQTDEPTTASAEHGPQDALGRGTPRGSITGFLKATSRFEFDKAEEYLDLRNLPPAVREVGGHELARQLNQVLSRAVWLDDYDVSDHPLGARGDGLPDYRDEIVRIPSAEGEVPLWMQRVPRGDGEMIWKISNRSVAQVPDLYDEYSFSAPVETVRSWFPESASFLGLEAFKWAILVAVALLLWPVFHLLGLLASRMLGSPERDTYPYFRKMFTGPLVLAGILITGGFVLDELGAGAYAQRVRETYTLFTFAGVWALWSFINLFKKVKENNLIEQNRPGAAKLLQPMSTLLKMVAVILGVLFWLNNIGVNITTVLAGLGVGGLAVALALQKPIEDMMAALTIFSQASVRVGDLCRYGTDTVGRVEDIGLRTTRIRTLTNSVVSIPNSSIAYKELENLSYRVKIRYWPTLRLRYDTTAQQLQKISRDIVDMLRASNRVHDEPVRVRFTDFAEDAILMKVHCFMKTSDFPESLQFREELNYEVLRIVEEAGARFALPGRSIVLEGEGHDSDTA